MDKVDAIEKNLSSHTSILEGIQQQTTRTNGRVTKLEDQVDIIQVKTENLGVKVAAGVFIACAATAELVRAIL